MDDGITAVGITQLTRAMRQLERTIPDDVDTELTESMEDIVLPEARRFTPVGDGRSGEPGRLRDATRVVRRRGQPAFHNPKVYARTRHWGRRRGGVVKGVRFISLAAAETDTEVAQDLAGRLDRLIASRLP